MRDPTGAAGDALKALGALVALSATFQAALGDENEDQAAGQVFFPHMQEGEANFTRAAAVITLGDKPLTLYRVAGGSQTQFCRRGQLRLLLGRPLENPTGDSRDEEIAFLNYVEAVIADLEEVAGADDHLNITGIDMDGTPARSDPRDVAEASDDAQPPFYLVELLVDWDQI